MANCIVYTGNNNGVNIRSSKSTGSGTLLGVIDNGVTVNIVRCDSTWATLLYNGAPAFVQHQYLQNPPSANGDGLSVGDSATCNANSVNIRDTAGGDTTGNYLNKGNTVSILGKASSGGYYWYKIGNGQWVRGDFLAPGTGSGNGSGSNGTGVNTATWEQVLNGSAVYRKESSGSAICEGVKTLQQYLKNIGYGSDNVGNIVVDGNFGTITENAVKRFQTECAITSDGIVGSVTANRLVSAQADTYFTNPDYFPIKSSLMTYTAFPKSQISLVARIICAEHGYAGSQHYDGRSGVAKVLKNRKDYGGVSLYDSSKPRDYKNVIFGPNQYTTAHSEMASYVARGTTAFHESVSLANTIWNGNTPAGASLVTNQLFQKGYAVWNSGYTSKPGYCRYPATGSKFSFFYNN